VKYADKIGAPSELVGTYSTVVTYLNFWSYDGTASWATWFTVGPGDYIVLLDLYVDDDLQLQADISEFHIRSE